MKFAEVKQFLVTGGAALFAAKRLVRTPSPGRWRNVEPALTWIVAGPVVLLDVIVPPGRHGWDYPVSEWCAPRAARR